MSRPLPEALTIAGVPNRNATTTAVDCSPREKRRLAHGGTENVLAGLTSWGEHSCGARYRPGWYTPISAYHDWIVDQTGIDPSRGRPEESQERQR